MTKVKKTQLALIAGAAVLCVLLYFANKKPSNEAKAESTLAQESNSSIESFVKTAESALPSDLKLIADDLMKKSESKEKNQWIDSLISFWDKNKKPDIASYWFEKKALSINNAITWFKAGDRYYYSIRFVKDNNELQPLYGSAIRCYEKGLKLDPKNTEAKIMLASCFVEGSPEPMKGVSMLKEIEKTDSNNVTLQLNFAFFSVKSQQWDKAIRRFQKVLEIDSTYIEAYLHLADVYEQTGEKNKTIEMLEKYKAMTTDLLAREEIEKYIKQLKN